MGKGTVVEITTLGQRHNVLNRYKAKVIQEYGNFYLVDRGIFKTCINKADIECSQVVINLI